MLWFLARKLIQIYPIKLCSPIIDTLLSDNDLLIRVHILILWRNKVILTLISALTVWHIVSGTVCDV